MPRAEILAALLLAAPLASGAARADEPSLGALTRVSPAVLRVEARSCGNAKPATATGFLWGAQDQAVTALHVVAGCSQVTVYSERLHRAIDAHAAHVLVAADLALLHLDQAMPLTPAELAPTGPELHEDLAVLGYSLAAPSMGDHLVRLAYGSSRLRDIVSGEVAAELRRNGTPSLDLDVLRLDGVQVPGNSGAPILNRAGLVVGIGDGGLEQGISSINWAVPAKELPKLLASADAMPADPMRTRESFAAELDVAPGAALQCGDIPFRRLRTRPFTRLQRTTDDPVALQQVISASPAIAMRVVPGLAYDVWVNEESGGAIALPAGSVPMQEAGLCVVHGNGSFAVHFGGSHIAGTAEAQLHSVRFERDVEAAHGNLFWQPDPRWSYAFPHVNGLEGVIIQRTSGYGFNPALGRPTAYATETLMARGDTFIGIAVVTDDYNPQMVAACQLMPQNPACAPVVQALETWLRYALGVLFSTFSAR